MTKLTILTLVLLFTSYPTQQEPRIIICTVVEVDKSVACPVTTIVYLPEMDKRPPSKSTLVSFTDPAEAKQIFDKWRLVAPLQGESVNGDAPLYSKTLKAGDEVKAIFTDTEFAPVKECNVRIWEALNKARRPGEILSNSLRWQPEDCQPNYGNQ
jgi:hypothetical protein